MDSARFIVKAPAGTPPGEYRLRAMARTDGQSFDRGYQVVDYPHTRRRHLDVPAETTLKVISVLTAPNLTVGYIVGVGDEVPPAIGHWAPGRDAQMGRPRMGELRQYDAT